MVENSPGKNLLIGVSGILSVYCVGSLLHEKLIIGEFYNHYTQNYEKNQNLLALVFFPALFSWVIGEIYNLRLIQRVDIPLKNALICGGIVFTSGFTLNWASALISFPVVVAVKSTNVLAVLLVAVFCTRVRDRNLNLSSKKIILGVIITIGVLIFNLFDPQIKDREIKAEALGIGLILISLFADGFLPDFQAQIKVEFKPQPTQMMAVVNKYIAIISLTLMVISFQLWEVLTFIFYHKKYSFLLLAFSLVGVIGQFFVYRLIKQFKQHIVPFVVTIRKILTVIINLIYYNHQVSFLQLIGMMIVTGAIVFQFVTQIKNQPLRNQKFQKVTDYHEQIQTDRASLETTSKQSETTFDNNQ